MGFCSAPNVSGKDALFVVGAIIVAVVVVSAVSMTAEAVADDRPQHRPQPPIRHRLFLVSDDAVTDDLAIMADDWVYLEPNQFAALAHGAYRSAGLCPTVWEGTGGRPRQPVVVTIVDGQVVISPAPEQPAAQPMTGSFQ